VSENSVRENSHGDFEKNCGNCSRAFGFWDALLSGVGCLGGFRYLIVAVSARSIDPALVNEHLMSISMSEAHLCNAKNEIVK
jgi:hypothetical protein